MRSTADFETVIESESMSDRPIHMLWVRIAMFDQDSFVLSLASASNMLAQRYDPLCLETAESMKYYTATVEAVGRRLRDTRQRISDELVGTVLGFTCLDVGSRGTHRHVC